MNSTNGNHFRPQGRIDILKKRYLPRMMSGRDEERLIVGPLWMISGAAGTSSNEAIPFLPATHYRQCVIWCDEIFPAFVLDPSALILDKSTPVMFVFVGAR